MRSIKYKYIIAFFIIGLIVNLFATLQKILHTPIANMMFTIAFFIMATSGLIAVIKLIATKDKNSFLDK
jgi:predicted membrane channel-forming protein YqfA (hemolysin III family)